jgi:hypothetical protein
MKIKKFKLLITSLLIFSLIISSSVAFAAFEDYPDIAAYIRGDVTNNNTLNVKGDLVITEGTYFMNGWTNNITGKIYFGGEEKVTLANQEMTIGFSTQANTGDTFTKDFSSLPQAPEMQSEGNLSTPWYPVKTFSENTAYDTLTLVGSAVFDTGSEGLVITTKNLVLNAGTHTLEGTGNLYIFVEEKIEVSGSISFNFEGDSSRVHIFVKNGDVNQKAQFDMSGNIYLQTGNYIQQGASARIFGNIVMAGNSLSLSNGLTINGAILAPNANVTLGGGFTLYGWLKADTLSVGSGTSAFLEHRDVIIEIPKLGFESEEPGDDDGEDGPVNDIPAGPRVIIDKGYEPRRAYLYGYDDETFGLGDSITREQAAALIYRLLKSKGKTGSFVPADETYSDLPSRHWSYAALEYMHSIGVYGQMNKISPTTNISRGEIAKIIAFSFRLQTDDSNPMRFADVERSNPYYFYIKALADNDISIGDLEGNYQPEATLTREQFVAMINRVVGREAKDHLLIKLDAETPDIYCEFKDIQDLGGSEFWIVENVMIATNDFVWNDEVGKFIIDNSARATRNDDYIY